MGNFIHHLTGSVVAGIACGGGAAYLFHATPIDSLACATLCGLGGLMPDVDSPVSKPTEFVVSITGALAPVFVMQAFSVNLLSASQILLLSVGAYLGTRFLIKQIIKRFTVHRGIIHSIPAAIIWGGLVFLAFRNSPGLVQNLAAASAVIGFITHLLIDEMFSLVDISGGKFTPKSSSGTALKFFGSTVLITIATYLCVAFILYLCAVEAKMVSPIF
ncbi:MAG: metal-dependent hydrolase [Bacteroidetes bacterium]|nr:metal-dependent hydrolase [Bacteroidota bacterium]